MVYYYSNKVSVIKSTGTLLISVNYINDLSQLPLYTLMELRRFFEDNKKHEYKNLTLVLIIFIEYQESFIKNQKMLENQLFYPIPKGSQLIFFAPHGAGVNEENQRVYMHDS